MTYKDWYAIKLNQPSNQPTNVSLAIHPYHQLFPTGLPDYILYLYRAVVDKFLLVVWTDTSMWRGP